MLKGLCILIALVTLNKMCHLLLNLTFGNIGRIK